MSIDNPLGQAVVQSKAAGGGALVAAEQQRAMAEVQAAMVVARANPRDPVQAMDLILNDCTRASLAEGAVYAYSRGGSDVSGPSIRLAEAIARRWGNIEFGVKELSRYDDHSVVMAYAWDLESNTRDVKTFTVKAWRDTKGGGYKLKDERDVYENLANQAARRKRACILAVIPGDVVEAAVRQCEMTLKAKADTSPDAIAKMVEAFEQFGVTKGQIEQRIQRHLDAISPAQMVGLKKVWASLRDGMAQPSDFFEAAETGKPEPEPTASKADAVLAAVKARKAAQAAQEPAGEAQQPREAPEVPEPAASAPTAPPTAPAAPAAKPKPTLKPAAPKPPAPAPAETRRERVDPETGEIVTARAAPGVTYARVMDMANRASTEEELDVALEFAAAFPEDQQQEIAQRVEERRREVEE